MNYADFKRFDTANGAGVRVSLFVSGCSFACRGCFNNGAWSYGSGKPFTLDTLVEVLQSANDDFIAGLSILGGEPLEPRNVEQVAVITNAFKAHYPDKTIWLWTGYEMHELQGRIAQGEGAVESILKDVDIVIDGKYDETLPTEKPYRGSDNQILWAKKDSFDGTHYWVEQKL